MSMHNDRKLKIAIFSGSIPSTSFIERLIEGVAEHHLVQIFGVVTHKIFYESKNIAVYKSPKTHSIHLMYTIYRAFMLLIKRPRHLIDLFKEIKRFSNVYDKWVWFTKLLPIVLYRPDIFHIQWARDVEFYMCLKERFQIPILLSLRGTHINYAPRVDPKVADLYRHCFPKIDAFHAVSKAISKEALKYGALSKNIHVIYSPVPSKLQSYFKPRYERTNSVIKVLTVGRFSWIKGYSYALQAISILKTKGYHVQYTLVCSNTISESLLFQINQLNLEEEVNVMNNLQQDDLFEIMSNYDMMLLSSLEEGIANVVLEGMAIGLPVISTNCGGMPEVVKPNETGWLVPIRDANAISKAVVDVLQTPIQELNNIRTSAHKLIKEEFNAEDSIVKFINLYQTIYKAN